MNSGGTPMEATPLPADKRALVAIDLGAESCRVSLLRWRGGRPEMSLVHRFANHAVESAAGLHWDLSSILAGLDEGLARCAGLAEEGIRSVAVDGWAVDYVRLSPRGEPIGQPFCYRDERTVAAMQTLHQRISADRMRALTGIQVLRLNTAYQMFADSANQRGLAWLNLPEYVLYRMGARAVSERTNASHTQLLGLDGAWCAEILGAIELPHAAMPELIDPGTDIGQLSGPLAELPAFAHTRLIAPACHDTASAIAAIPDGGDDWAYISSGTWSLVGTLLDAPNNSQTARSENFTNLVGANGKICLHKNVNGMWLLRQCLESWAAEGFALDLRPSHRRRMCSTSTIRTSC
jgi:rhamnulokinase